MLILDASLAFRKRPSDELAMALNVDLVSSGTVLGASKDGYVWSSISLICGG
jgi:hypothetical protein